MGTDIEEALVAALQERGLEIVAKSELDFYRNLHPAALLFNVLSQNERELISPYLAYSKSQLAQDLFALAFCKATSPKFFVEFGATDGISLSNTWLLEKKLGWSGILAEPAKIWHTRLNANRNCIVDTRCVANKSCQEVRFLEVNQTEKGSPELSGIKQYADNGDWASSIRIEESTEYSVETISLEDLLDAHQAPEEIQFLSIDTEGSELDIIKDFDFQKRKIHSICIEHNFVAASRQGIHSLLTSNGYQQVLGGLTRWDDWYILAAP
jgi:FkbM family methyltransferase